MTKQKEYELQFLENGIATNYRSIYDEYRELFSSNPDFETKKYDVRSWEVTKQIDDMPLHQFASRLVLHIEELKYCSTINKKKELQAEYYTGEFDDLRQSLTVLKKEVEKIVEPKFKRFTKDFDKEALENYKKLFKGYNFIKKL